MCYVIYVVIYTYVCKEEVIKKKVFIIILFDNHIFLQTHIKPYNKLIHKYLYHTKPICSIL